MSERIAYGLMGPHSPCVSHPLTLNHRQNEHLVVQQLRVHVPFLEDSRSAPRTRNGVPSTTSRESGDLFLSPGHRHSDAHAHAWIDT